MKKFLFCCGFFGFVGIIGMEDFTIKDLARRDFEKIRPEKICKKLGVLQDEVKAKHVFFRSTQRKKLKEYKKFYRQEINEELLEFTYNENEKNLRAYVPAFIQHDREKIKEERIKFKNNKYSPLMELSDTQDEAPSEIELRRGFAECEKQIKPCLSFLATTNVKFYRRADGSFYRSRDSKGKYRDITDQYMIVALYRTGKYKQL